MFSALALLIKIVLNKIIHLVPKFFSLFCFRKSKKFLIPDFFLSLFQTESYFRKPKKILLNPLYLLFNSALFLACSNSPSIRKSSSLAYIPSHPGSKDFAIKAHLFFHCFLLFYKSFL